MKVQEWQERLTGAGWSFKKRLEAAEALGRDGGPAAAEVLLGMLLEKQRSKPRLRTEIARILGVARGQKKLVEGLVEVAERRGESKNVREQAIYSVGKQNGYAYGGRLLRLLDELDPDSDQLLWQSVVITLGRLGLEEAVPLLVNLLRRTSSTQKPYVLWSLGEIGSSYALDALEGTLKHDGSPPVRVHAVWSLGRIGDAAALPALLEAYGDPSEQVRSSVLFAFAYIIERLPEPQSLCALLRRPDPKMPESRMVSLLLEAFAQDPERFGTNALVSLIRIVEHTCDFPTEHWPMLLEGFGAHNPGTRANLCEFFGRVGHQDLALCEEAVIPALERALDDGDEITRGNAAWALGRLYENLRSADQVQRAERLHASLGEKLVQRLEDEREETRLEARVALWKMEEERLLTESPEEFGLLMEFRVGYLGRRLEEIYRRGDSVGSWIKFIPQAERLEEVGALLLRYAQHWCERAKGGDKEEAPKKLHTLQDQLKAFLVGWDTLMQKLHPRLRDKVQQRVQPMYTQMEAAKEACLQHTMQRWRVGFEQVLFDL